jgi:hypothetical protein
MTEVEFLHRFQGYPNGVWACTKPIRIDGPKGPFIIRPGVTFSPGALLLGSISPRSLIRWRRGIGLGLPESQQQLPSQVHWERPCPQKVLDLY